MTINSIFKPGINCWLVAHAKNVSFLVDGAEYFHAFREAAKNAEQSLLIVGWDINSRLQLERNPTHDDLPNELGKFLNSLLKRNNNLQIHVLSWDFAMLYASDREWLSSYKADWRMHKRLHFHLDDQHPTGASHHQKVVVIDDHIAFAGGLDLTFGRWDTPQHRPDDPMRRDSNKHIPQPYHDVQMMVSGKIAKSLGDLARERWQKATDQFINPPDPANSKTAWPKDIKIDLSDVNVAIARTYGKYNGQNEIREAQHFLIDAIQSAEKSVYIENQYLTSEKLGDALRHQLRKKHGPEVVILLPQRTDGWLSRNTMDVLRERLIKQLFRSDKYNRLRVYYPFVPGLQDQQCINVHAKVLIIDNELIRIGSTNFNNRSMGLDSECDLAIEANNQARVRQAIASFRHRLLAEHLGVTSEIVDKAENKTDSLVRVIESLNHNARSLKPLPLRVSGELDALVPESKIADPEQPFDSDYFASNLIPDEDKPSSRRTVITLASILIIALLLAAVWRWTPLGEWIIVGDILNTLSALQGSWAAPVIVSAVYVIGGLVVFPVTLMIIATGLAFGAYYGFAYALLGAELSAIVNYAIGHYLGFNTVQRLSHRWVARVSRRLARQGLLAVIILRIIPVAPFSVINMVAGASHIRFRDFSLGTLLGMFPGTLMLTVFSDQVVNAIRTPEAAQIGILLVLAVLIGVGSWSLSRWLLKRQHINGKQH